MSTRSLLLTGAPSVNVSGVKVRDHPVHGRQVVAVKAVPAGGVIFSEKPCVVVPGFDEEGRLTCFGCCRSTAASPLRCAACAVPVCSAACMSAPAHRAECAVMRRCGYRFVGELPDKDANNIMTIFVGALRLLLLQGAAAERWRALDFDRKQQEKQRAGVLEMANLLYPPVVSYDPDLVFLAWCVVNANSLRFEGKAKKRAGSCVLAVGPRVGHSCVPNSNFHFWVAGGDEAGPEALSELRLVFQASVPIAAGGEVTMTAADLWAGAGRRLREVASKRPGGQCRCRRCRDPDDFGLFVDSPCCPKCRDGGVQAMLVPQRSQFGAGFGDADWPNWRCRRCKKRPAAAAKSKLTAALDACGALVHSGDFEEPLAAQQFLEDELFPRGLLHDNFGLVLQLKHAMAVDILGHVEGYKLEQLSAEHLLFLESCCRGVLSAMDVLEPGVSPKRGLVTLALARARLEHVKRTATAPPNAETMAALDEADGCLRSAVECLRWRRYHRPELLRDIDAVENARTLLGWLTVLGRGQAAGTGRAAEPQGVTP